ncbi:MAG: CoA transferase [Chloroflexi bacterium]|nr:CoA transferase [Chloroflexota bacterium]
MSEVGGPRRALSGIRILDLSRILSGPYCTMMLADLGAEVIKIETPDGGDPTRHLRPFVNGEGLEFLAINRNKKGLVLDLKQPAGARVFKELVAISDVVVENFRPGAADRLGLGHTQLSKINPRLVYCAISGFGDSGPLRERSALDAIVQGMGGIMSLTGELGQPPVMVGTPIGDLAAGLFAALGITTALVAREATGRGQFVDIAMLDCQVALLAHFAPWYLATGEVPQPRGGGNPRLAPFGVFRARDSYFTIGVLGEDVWRRFCLCIERPELIADLRFATNAVRHENKTALYAVLGEVLAGEDAAVWLERLAAKDIPCGPINTIDRVVKDPQVIARGMIAETEHPIAGRVGILGNPIKLSGNEDSYAPSPTYGEHTEEVLRDLLGYDPSTIRGLREAGALGSGSN